MTYARVDFLAELGFKVCNLGSQSVILSVLLLQLDDLAPQGPDQAVLLGVYVSGRVVILSQRTNNVKQIRVKSSKLFQSA